MKKILLVFFMAVSAVLLFTSSAYAAGTGNIVIHFHAWDDDYTDLGNHGWEGLSQKPMYDGLDDFGAYFEFNDVPIDGANPMGFIAVRFNGANPDWDNGKLTGDVRIDSSVVIEDETVHIYIFEGASSTESDPGAYYVASNDHYNMLLVYFDPTGGYEETLGVHAWSGWIDTQDLDEDEDSEEALPAEWGTPAQVFTDAGEASDGTTVKAAMLSSTASDAGLLVYAGEDANKKTGDVNLASALSDTPALGDMGVAYVLSKGDAYTAGDNIYYNDPVSFNEFAFSFRLVEFDAEDMEGTYAVNPHTIIVKLSTLVDNPYASAATEAEQMAAEALIKSWFTVREKLGEDTYRFPETIERVDFAKTNTTLDSFVLILAGDGLDNMSDYELTFDLGLDKTVPAKDVTVTLNVTVPDDNAEAVLSIGSNINGWNPAAEGYSATQVGTTNVWQLTFTVSVSDPYTTISYKWTNGSWDTVENVSDNRTIIIPNSADSLEYDDVIEWTGDAYEPTVRGEEKANLKASIEVAMDAEAPVISFISPTAIVGLEAAQRIIEVPWGVRFNQNLFPRYRAEDNRDGDLTAFVYVPSGDNAVLDTRTEGDYTIMLRIEDEWGNVTEETFIFRVVTSE